MTSTSASPLRRIDGHVHLVGIGAGGTGCRYGVGGWTRLARPFLLKSFGLPADAFSRDLDHLYVETLIGHVKESELDAVIVLAHDDAYHEDGTVWPEFSPMHVPNGWVLELGRRHKELLPAVSIHPGRADALEELERCLEGGAVALKYLPNCQNINPAREAYTRFWERVAEARLPVIAHTGGENTLPECRREFRDPQCWIRPLEAGIVLVAAHAGTRSALTDPDYFEIFDCLVRRFLNLYADTSALGIPIRSRRLKEVFQEPLVRRMVHGSDLPIPSFPRIAALCGDADRRGAMAAAKIRNPLQKDLMLKRAAGCPDSVLTRWDTLIGAIRR